MTGDECSHLVERIVQTWPNGPRGRIWTEALTTLDPGRAGTTYVRLRDELEQAPTIGRFMTTYRSLDTARTNDWRRPEEPNAISLNQYLAKLATRAQRGDHAATAELEAWARRGHNAPPANVVNLFDEAANT